MKPVIWRRPAFEAINADGLYVVPDPLLFAHRGANYSDLFRNAAVFVHGRGMGATEPFPLMTQRGHAANFIRDELGMFFRKLAQCAAESPCGLSKKSSVHEELFAALRVVRDQTFRRRTSVF